MESNESYYRRRAIQELAAARRAVTQHAWSRRRALAETYLLRLAELTGVDQTQQLEALVAAEASESGASQWRPTPAPDAPAGLPAPRVVRTANGRSWILE